MGEVLHYKRFVAFHFPFPSILPSLRTGPVFQEILLTKFMNYFLGIFFFLYHPVIISSIISMTNSVPLVFLNIITCLILRQRNMSLC